MNYYPKLPSVRFARQNTNSSLKGGCHINYVIERRSRGSRINQDLKKRRVFLVIKFFVSGLPLDARLAQKDAVPRCGVMVIDLDTGKIAHWLELEGVVKELFDVVVLPNIKQPMALGFKTDEIEKSDRPETRLYCRLFESG